MAKPSFRTIVKKFHKEPTEKENRAEVSTFFDNVDLLVQAFDSLTSEQKVIAGERLAKAGISTSTLDDARRFIKGIKMAEQVGKTKAGS
jgi:hypothetical protein